MARIICDINRPDGSPFAGDPRAALKQQIARAKKLGFTMNAGMEAEFFMFKRAADGAATTQTHDVGSYFDLAPVDLGEEARRSIVDILERMGFEVEAAHHEVAHGQHEIDFRYADALTTADNIATFRFVVKYVAQQFGLVASFMPKPMFGQNGSGMHTHQSLFRGKENAFCDPKAQWELSKTALHYIGGLLRHARGYCAITNPLVNSYKRLVPGYEAPVNVAWSMRNRSPMIRIPERRGLGTRVELRVPDPAANPYLALAVMLAAGLEGIETKRRPPGAGGPEHLGDELPREAAPADRRSAARSQRGVRRAREGQGDRRRRWASTSRPISSRRRGRSGGSTSARSATGNSTITSPSTNCVVRRKT